MSIQREEIETMNAAIGQHMINRGIPKKDACQMQANVLKTMDRHAARDRAEREKNKRDWLTFLSIFAVPAIVAATIVLRTTGS